MYVYICTHVIMYIYIYREREMYTYVTPSKVWQRAATYNKV